MGPDYEGPGGDYGSSPGSYGPAGPAGYSGAAPYGPVYDPVTSGYPGSPGQALPDDGYYSPGGYPGSDPVGVPPFPAQVQPEPSTGIAARITGPLAALTRPRLRKTARFAGVDQDADAGVPPPPPRRPARVRPARSSQADPGASGSSGSPGPPPEPSGSRRAQLVLSRIEPWSVMKFSFMISLIGWVILFVAVAVLYYVLDKLGVFHAIETTVSDVTSTKTTSGTNAGAWFSASRILGYTMLIGAVNVILITALATVGAVIYNLVTHLAGGIEVTLEETD